MATKWKNYDPVFRVLAVFLVMLTAFSSCFFAYTAAKNYVLFDVKNTENYYDTPYFTGNLGELLSDLSTIARYNNKKYLSETEEKQTAYSQKQEQLQKEQREMEIRLDQMLWLQDRFPVKDTTDINFDPYYFVNCFTASDYFNAFDAIAPNVIDEAKFYALLDTGKIPKITETTAHTAPAVTEAPTVPTASGEQTDITEPSAVTTEVQTSAVAVETTRMPTTSRNEDVIAPSSIVYGDKYGSFNYFEYDEESGENLYGIVQNPSGYAVELKGYTDPETWLCYYYQIRSYLVGKVGTPIYSSNIYNYATAHLDIDSEYWYGYGCFGDWSTMQSIKYLFIYSETGEYMTNIEDFLPGKNEPLTMYSSENTEEYKKAVSDCMDSSEWSFAVTKDGVKRSNADRSEEFSTFQIDVFDLGLMKNLSVDTCGGEIYLYSDMESVERNDSDIFKYCHSAFAEAKRYQNLYMALGVISVLVFLLTSAYILSVGTKKSVAVDKLYNDWHFVISTTLAVLAGIGCVEAFFYRWQNDPYSSLYYLLHMEFLIPLAAAGMLLILLEYLTSVIRSKRNGQLIKHFSWYVFFAYIKRKCKKLTEKYIKVDPTYYKKQYKIALITGIIFTIVTTVFSAIGSFGVMLVPVLAADVAVLIFSLQHLKAMSLITEASEMIRQGDYSVQIDMQKIPKHLKPLAANVLHNRDGIKNAVEKSVKDERLKAELITNVSHDLKTPLTSMVTYVDLLKKSNITDEKALGYIDILEEKSDKLKHLIEDLTEASKASTGNIKLNLMNVDLYEMALQAIGENADAMDMQDLEVIINDPVGNAVVYADNQQTWRMIDNLFSNVKKYAMPGTRVYVDVRTVGENGVFSIKNISKNALNIPAEELTKRFVRGDNSRSGDGSGLGLSIAKSLCELQNGVFKLDIDGDLFKATVMLPKATKTE